MARRRFFALALVACACSPAPMNNPPKDQPPSTTATPPAPAFDDDVAFLKKHGAVQILEAPGGGRVALSAKYQGRVMTSAVEPNGRSLGWIHRKFIEEGKTGTQFDNYGGEDRFWLGPEGGQFSLYFPAGKPFKFDFWQTPAAFQEGEWTATEATADHVTFTKSFKLANYSGAPFELEVKRTVSLLSQKDVEAATGAPLPAGAKWIAFESKNVITNKGSAPWTKDKGLVSVWILGMYNPTPDTYVVVPFETSASGPIVNDTYFGKVPADRLLVDEKGGAMLFKCDGKHRSKIGLGPKRAKKLLGSYSPQAKLLTIVSYDKPDGATDYVNSMWEMQKEPYGGDVVNSYNDGPPEPGKPPLGGFYELETSSPAAALAPGASLVHTHRTMHFVGPDTAALDPLATKALGMSATAVAQRSGK
jgi:hypothetical protein